MSLIHVVDLENGVSEHIEAASPAEACVKAYASNMGIQYTDELFGEAYPKLVWGSVTVCFGDWCAGTDPKEPKGTGGAC